MRACVFSRFFVLFFLLQDAFASLELALLKMHRQANALTMQYSFAVFVQAVLVGEKGT